MRDIIERLREKLTVPEHPPTLCAVVLLVNAQFDEAADEIERLRTEFASKTKDADHFFKLSGRQLEQLAKLEGDCIALAEKVSLERASALEEAEAACVKWGDEKVLRSERAGLTVEMIDNAKACAWSGLQCAAAIRALRNRANG